jgi:hypothetical protein
MLPVLLAWWQMNSARRRSLGVESGRQAEGREDTEPWNTELRLMPSAVTVRIWSVCGS